MREGEREKPKLGVIAIHLDLLATWQGAAQDELA
jgi:hypothetical protein